MFKARKRYLYKTKIFPKINALCTLNVSRNTNKFFVYQKINRKNKQIRFFPWKYPHFLLFAASQNWNEFSWVISVCLSTRRSKRLNIFYGFPHTDRVSNSMFKQLFDTFRTKNNIKSRAIYHQQVSCSFPGTLNNETFWNDILKSKRYS